MKDLYIDNYGKTSQRLSAEDSNFIHYLWVNFDPNDPKYKDVIPEEIRAIPNLQISNIREFEGHPLYQNTVDFLENGRAASKFVEASDLVRVMATEAKGGLYHDLDWKLYDAKEMIKYMKNFDFIGGREGEEWTSSIGNAMFAAKAEHPVVRKLSQLIDRNLNEKNPDLLPDYIKYPQREFDRIISSSGPIAITMAYNLEGNKDENRDLVCPSKVLYNADYARSHQTGDHHNPQELKHSWQMIPIKTIGGDQFSGNWGHSYQETIKYNRNDLRVKGQKELADELNKAVEQGNKEMFDALLPRITAQHSLADALYKAVEQDNKEMFDALLPRITTQHYLAGALYKTVDQGKEMLDALTKNRREMLETLLPKVTDLVVLDKTFNTAVVLLNNKEMLDMLTKVTDPAVLGAVLNAAVVNNRQEMFDLLLPKVTDPAVLDKALDTAVIFDNKEMFDTLLPKVTDPAVLGAVLNNAVRKNKQEMFDSLLPKVTDSSALGAALNTAVGNNRQEMFDSLLPKVTDSAALGEALDTAVIYDNKEMLDVLLTKITDQEVLGKALDTAVWKNRQEIFETLLPKVTDSAALGEVFDTAVIFESKEMLDMILPKVTDQKSLVKALNTAVEHDSQQVFATLLPRIRDKKILEEVLGKARQENRKVIIGMIQATQNYRYYIGDNIDFVSNLLSSSVTTLNGWFKKNDPLKIPGSADAARVSAAPDVIAVTASGLNKPTSAGKAAALPDVNREERGAESQATQAQNLKFANTINERIFMGTATLAIAMHAVGQNTDWAKPMLGGGDTKVETDFNLRDSLSYVNPEYDYATKLEEAAKKAPPLQQAALERITELAQSNEVESLSKEEWEDLIKNDKKLKMLLDVAIENAKIRQSNSRPITQADLDSPKKLIKTKGRG